MSADAYAKLVAHNNSIVQQFKSYKETQERVLADAYARLAALKDFCAKEREEMCDTFEKEKQDLVLERDRHSNLALEKQALAFEREKQEMRQAFEREKQAMRDTFDRDRHSALALERQSGGAVDTNEILNKALSGFFRNV